MNIKMHRPSEEPENRVRFTSRMTDKQLWRTPENVTAFIKGAKMEQARIIQVLFDLHKKHGSGAFHPSSLARIITTGQTASEFRDKWNGN